MVVDSGPTYAYAQQAYKAMQEKEKLPVKYVINTSSEELNILGNEFYKEQGATLIGPKSYEKRIKEQKPLTILEKLSNTIFTNTRLIPLDVYQNSDTTISIGKRKIEIKKLEKDDSKNLIVYLPSEETIFVGNYISNKRIPELKEHESLNEWIKNIKSIEKLSWKHIITAHGVKTTRRALTSTKNYLTKLKKTVLESIQNPSSNKINDTFGTYQHIAFFKEFHTENIQKAYDELKIAKLKTDKVKADDETTTVLTAMSNIKTSKILKEGTGKTIISSKNIEKPKEKIKKEKEHIKISKVEITQETSVQSIIEEASKAEIAPTTEEEVPCISYDKDYDTAQRDAIKEHKMVFIKVEADNCVPCAELDQMLKSNKKLRKIINKYTTAIKINTSYETVPLGITNRGTPTVIVLNPETNKVLVKLEGMDEVEDLEDSLRSITGEEEEETISLAFAQ